MVLSRLLSEILFWVLKTQQRLETAWTAGFMVLSQQVLMQASMKEESVAIKAGSRSSPDK